ncbi:glycosyl transferase family 2 [Leptospira ryugenii]|uniref:Glycosyl transferase family 2 n=1 Tax=Leptospira ryugenii TaxID=1917863 RepID=A0A2P2DW26_9LEPT|nr:glycosyl transferase family 2 [Leptospira ryugenii]
MDRFLDDPEHAIDVIIPIMHTNELWEANLHSIYREVPVNRLLLGDGGAIDDSLDIAKKFPRVVVLDQKNFKSLGYCIRNLIENVETEWFAYFHSDVYLPEQWFDKMLPYQKSFDWYGCPMRHTIMVDYPGENNIRPYAGTQIGRKEAFRENLHTIDDDYVYRQEDFVFESLVEKGGYKNGKVEDTFHYHQTMFRPSKWMDLKVKNVSIDVNRKKEEIIRSADMQVRGVIKYLKPNRFYAFWIIPNFVELLEHGELNWSEFKAWTKKTNPEWLPYLSYFKIRLVHLWFSPSIRKNIRDWITKVFFRQKIQ